MSDTIVVVAAFAVLLGLEWRYRRRGLRVGTALLALAALFYFQPSYTLARRRALGAPRSERVTLNPVAGSERDRVSDYDSGVYTTMRWVAFYDDLGAGARFAAVGALVWLACSPARAPSNDYGARAGADAPEADVG